MQKLTLPNLNKCEGEIILPGSKSISNRALLLAALCNETTELFGVLRSDDTNVMLDCLTILGCDIYLKKQIELMQ